MVIDLQPLLSLDEAQKVVEGKTAPKVTKQLIENRIAKVDYHTQGTLTICVITMVNGWKSVGSASPDDARNFDPEVGRRYAYEDAFRPLWHLEGYRLRDTLWRLENLGYTEVTQEMVT